MNKENKMINIALRVMIFLTFVMSIVSLSMLGTGLTKIDTKDLTADNVGERLLGVISDFAKNTSLYYVVLGMTAVCLVLAVITRYKTTLVSFIFKILAIGYTLISLISGMEYVGAVGACKDVTNIIANGTDSASVAAALSAGGVSDAETIANTLTNKDSAALGLAGYMLPIIVFFVLSITSIHCLVKRHDPNNKGGNESNDN